MSLFLVSFFTRLSYFLLIGFSISFSKASNLFSIISNLASVDKLITSLFNSFKISSLFSEGSYLLLTVSSFKALSFTCSSISRLNNSGNLTSIYLLI